MSRPKRCIYLSLKAARVIYDQVSIETGVSLDDLLGARRRYKRARWQVMQAMRARGASYPMIGKRMGVHHTTVMHGIKQLEKAG